jgi:hypothetical protein
MIHNKIAIQNSKSSLLHLFITLPRQSRRPQVSKSSVCYYPTYIVTHTVPYITHPRVHRLSSLYNHYDCSLLELAGDLRLSCADYSGAVSLYRLSGKYLSYNYGYLPIFCRFLNYGRILVYSIFYCPVPGSGPEIICWCTTWSFLLFRVSSLCKPFRIQSTDLFCCIYI